ncbi:hypothetical protein P4E94_19480 [Pontiellaceae bacterium B12219]|nr:hypothetical protein [Pontiellaceae bacterium B12219]
MKSKRPFPSTPNNWMKEVSEAYLDAYETIPFGKYTGAKLSEETLFQLAPIVCLKFRGIKNNKKNLKLASDASLSSYVATKEITPELFETPQMTFAFCYIGSHLGLDLLQEEMCLSILDHIEQNIQFLIQATTKN